MLKIAGSLEKNSEHPLAEAILEKTQNCKIELIDVKEFDSVSGRGVKGKIEGTYYFGGNIEFIKENNIYADDFEEESEQFLKQGKTVIYIADENSIIGIIAVADTIKEDSYKAIHELKKENIDVIMLTRR